MIWEHGIVGTLFIVVWRWATVFLGDDPEPLAAGAAISLMVPGLALTAALCTPSFPRIWWLALVSVVCLLPTATYLLIQVGRFLFIPRKP